MRNFKRGLWSMLVVVMAVFAMSCEDEKETVAPSIVGTWTVVDFVRSGCTDAASNGTLTFDCPDFCMSFTFNADGTGSNTYKDPNATSPQIDEGVYTVTGNSMTFCDVNNTDCSTATIVVTETTLSYTVKEEDSGCDLTVNMIKS